MTRFGKSVFGVIISFLGLFIGAKTVFALTYSSDIGVKFTFGASLQINLSSPDLIISNLSPGTDEDSNTIDVIVKTNNATGYVLNATVGNNTTYNTRNLVHELSGSSANFASINYGSSLTNLTTDNTWGYSYSTDNRTTWSNYDGLPLYSDATNVATLKTATGPASTNAGDKVNFKIAAKASTSQPSGEYNNVINFIATANPVPTPAPVACETNRICYNDNSLGEAEGTMGKQSASANTETMLLASNFSREGYGFAGWSDVYDYEYNPSGHIYGPNEDIVTPVDMSSGLSLYAVWIESTGSLQDWNGCNNLIPAYFSKNAQNEADWSLTADLSRSVVALTDDRDGQTYAVARLSDEKCWMIENLRLADTHKENNSVVATVLTPSNTFNPLNDDDLINPTVTLKHNYTDTNVYTTLSATSNVAYNATTAPDGWCTTNSSACFDQSRLRTDNTTNRATYTSSQTMTANANIYSYGNYYNWYSATAGRGTYSITSFIEGDLCPHGWNLPFGGNKGEFGRLSNWLGGYEIDGAAQQMTSATSPTDAIMQKRFRHFPNNFLRAGYVNGASISVRGSEGYYWAGTAYNNNSAYRLGFDSTTFGPGTNSGYKYYGRTMRCIITTLE